MSIKSLQSSPERVGLGNTVCLDNAHQDMLLTAGLGDTVVEPKDHPQAGQTESSFPRSSDSLKPLKRDLCYRMSTPLPPLESRRGYEALTLGPTPQPTITSQLFYMCVNSTTGSINTPGYTPNTPDSKSSLLTRCIEHSPEPMTVEDKINKWVTNSDTPSAIDTSSPLTPALSPLTPRMPSS